MPTVPAVGRAPHLGSGGLSALALTSAGRRLWRHWAWCPCSVGHRVAPAWLQPRGWGLSTRQGEGWEFLCKVIPERCPLCTGGHGSGSLTSEPHTCRGHSGRSRPWWGPGLRSGTQLGQKMAGVTAGPTEPRAPRSVTPRTAMCGTAGFVLRPGGWDPVSEPLLCPELHPSPILIEILHIKCGNFSCPNSKS